jgi:hypothetical protein
VLLAIARWQLAQVRGGAAGSCAAVAWHVSQAA